MRLRTLLPALVVAIVAIPLVPAAAKGPALPASLCVDVLGLLSPRRVDVQSATSIRLSNGWSLAPESTVSIDVDRRALRLRVSGRSTWRGPRLTVGSSGDVVIADVTGRNQRTRRLPGPVELECRQNRIVIRATFDLETLVASAVSAEMEGETKSAALEAAAIAIRSYLAASVRRHARDGFDVCDSTHCVHSVGLPALTTDNIISVTKAVSATTATVLVRNDRIIAGYINACCGGQTTTPSGLWGTNDRGDYVSVECAWCRASSFATWKRSVPVSSLAATLADSLDQSLGADFSLRADRDRAGWVRSIWIGSGTVHRHLSGDDFRMAVGRRLGWDTLPSPNFAVVRHRSTFVFEGSGFGHGIGLCLAGASARARAGQTSHEVLQAYFPRAVIVALPRASGGV